MSAGTWKPDDEDDEPVSYSLVWRFIDGSNSFVLGVEAGRLYERMLRGDSPVEATTHSENEEELRNMANSSGYRAAFEDAGDDCWQFATFTKSAAPSSPHPGTEGHT